MKTMKTYEGATYEWDPCGVASPGTIDAPDPELARILSEARDAYDRIEGDDDKGE